MRHRLTALGGFGAKGPACFLLEVGSARLLLDLGRGPDRAARPRLEGAYPVDAVLISHGHPDHVGSMDWLDRLGNPPVHATAPVRKLSDNPVLRDAADLPPDSVIAGVPVQTGPAGHAPGAVWIRIGGCEGMIYSGDYCPEGEVFAHSPLPSAQAAVLDCSYGTSRSDLTTQRGTLIEMIGRGPSLLPVPPEGRGIEIALACLDADLPVAICPQLRHTIETLRRFPGWLAPGAAERLSELLKRAAPLDPDDRLTGVALAAGPNGGSGLSQELAPRALAENLPVILTGHVSDGSPAAQWLADGHARWHVWNVHPSSAVLSRMLEQTGAHQVMAAFADPDRQEQLARAFPETGWSPERSLAW